MYFHQHLDTQSKKDFWLKPLVDIFRKKKTRTNFICFILLMMNLFIIMEFSLKIESLWGLSSIGKFYLLIYCSDVFGAVLSLFVVNRVSRTILNRVHTALILVLSLVVAITSLAKSLSMTPEIILLSTFNKLCCESCFRSRLCICSFSTQNCFDLKSEFSHWAHRTSWLKWCWQYWHLFPATFFTKTCTRSSFLFHFRLWLLWHLSSLHRKNVIASKTNPTLFTHSCTV